MLGDLVGQHVDEVDDLLRAAIARSGLRTEDVGGGGKVGEGAVLENCIIMRDTYIGDGITLKNVIADKYVRVETAKELIGSENVPVVIPRGYTT